MRVSHIKNYLDDQVSHMDFISSAVNNLTSVGVSNVPSHRIETQKTALQEEWSKFTLKNDAIKIAVRRLTSRDNETILRRSYFSEKLFNDTQEAYLKALETMNSMLDRLKKDSRSPSVQSGSQVSSFPSSGHSGPRLPYLNLPSFDGSPSEWLPFKDLFDSMVLLNLSLSPVWKLHYLKQCLKGTAAHLLKNTTLTNDIFQKAWDSLVAFYENKRLLVNSALHSFITLKRMTKESSVEIETLYTSVTQIHRSLETLSRPVDKQDDFFVFLTVQKLDCDTINAWELHLGSSQDPATWKKLVKLLLTRLLTLKAVEKSRKPANSLSSQPARVNLASEDQQNNTQCSFCSEEHYIAKCPEYTGKTVQDRTELVRKNRLCYNCLGSHRVADCRSTRRSSDQGEELKVRALVDPGSQISFISEKLVQSLKLPRQNTSVPLMGIGAVKAGRTRGIVSINLRPHFESSTKLQMRTYILPKLTARFASAKINNVQWTHLNDLQLADPDITSPSEIDIIIGADYYGLILEEGIRRGSSSSPTAQATSFGWILFGPSNSSPAIMHSESHHVSLDEELYDLL
ncbi:uncharacterized protein LOC122501538 [Leptopilina heterotoma]|uniref:uncharacterized protein LOC122501538 n=1 Tax=Leptopilina heterotoma TaxID=63436 RepID=UPI001CA94C28|nr:uncharacterized protein LOC122501538 [Leptopilina heterotoma]